MSRTLYLVRHGEQQDAEYGVDDGPLSARGVRQANAIANRLSGVPFTLARHSPLKRADDTANIMAEAMPGVEFRPSALLFDCIPTGYSPSMSHSAQPFFNSVTLDEVEAGRAQLADAVTEFFAPTREPTSELLITHNFVISWFVREALNAPEWRWVGINQANCGLTIITVKTGRAPELLVHNDLGHLLPELRTGLPEAQQY